MKKITAALLPLVLCIGMLFSCSGQRVSTQEELVYLLDSGFLYMTSLEPQDKLEREYLEKRNKAVEMFVEEIKNTAVLSLKVTKGIIEYEDELLGYVDAIKDMDRVKVQDITGKMLAYRVILESLADEIDAYMKAKAKNTCTRSMISSYLTDVLNKTVVLQEEYISFLVSSSTAVSGMLQKTSERQARKVLSSTESVYSRKIESQWSEMKEGYEKCGYIYSYMISADHYASGYYVEKTKKTLEILGAPKYDEYREEIDTLISIYDEFVKIKKKPENIKEVVFPQSKSLWSMTVMAADETDPQLGRAISALDQLSQSDEIYSGSDPLSEDARQLQESSFFDYVPEEIRRPLEDAAQGVKDTFLISYITKLQREIRESGGSIEEQYDRIINILADQIMGGKIKDDPDETDRIQHLIFSELETLLGDSKPEFVNSILNSNAQELIDSYNDWKDKNKNTRELGFDRTSLILLLNSFGFTVKAPETQMPVSETTGKGSSEATSVSTTVTESVDPETSQTHIHLEEDWIVIKSSYGSIRSISPEESNDRIMFLIYGWTDDIDYSLYEKKENKDSEGNITYIEYRDYKGEKIGWSIQAGSDNSVYRYYVPGNKDVSIEILRKGKYPETSFQRVSVGDEGQNRSSGVSFDDDSELMYIWSKIGTEKDGLNMQRDSSRRIVEMCSEGKVLESYVYKNDVMVEEMYYEYSGDVIFRDLTRYYENGQVWIKANEIGREQTEYYTSFKPDGKYYSYYENGNISSYREYKEGVYHGEFINYYEDGMQRELITYSEGEKNGLYLRNYASGSIEIEGGYINGSPDGVWYKYKENGDPISEIGYKEGINHGIFHQYATGSTQSESIHVTGQYEEGKKTGIWLYGYNNEGYVEKYYYENDIKIWREAGNTRTYYDQEGSVIKEEKIN